MPFRITAAMCVSALVVACTGTEQAARDSTSTRLRDTALSSGTHSSTLAAYDALAPSIDVRMLVSQSVTVGEPIRMEIIVQNGGRDTALVQLGYDAAVEPAVPLFDIVVREKRSVLTDTTPVWRRSAVQARPGPRNARIGVQHEIRMAPGAQIIGTASWNQHGVSDRAVTPGLYEVIGIINVNGRAVITPPVSLRILP